MTDTAAQAGTIAVVVPLASSELALDDSLLAHYGKAWPDAPAITNVEAHGPTITFDVAGGSGIVSLVPNAVPWGDIEAPAAVARLWPDASSALRSHTAQAVVGVMNASLSPKDLALLATRLTASVVEATPGALGVFWPNGPLVSRRDVFLELSSLMAEDDLPLLLWVDVRVVRGESDFEVFTSGLAAFEVMEIEVPRTTADPRQVVDLVLGLAQYLLEHGPVVSDGDTIHAAEGGAIVVRHATSGWRPGELVYQLDL